MIILSVGANTFILQEITIQLNKHGFNATWTNFPETVSTLFNGKDIDIVAFGGGVKEKTRLFIMKIFSVQNPAIIFVNGLAPIPSLLVDQIRHTAILAQGRNGNPMKDISVNKKQFSIGLNANKECRLKINLYQLSPFYNITEKTLVDTTLAPGKHSFEIDKKDRQLFAKNFVVIKADNKPWFIDSLN